MLTVTQLLNIGIGILSQVCQFSDPGDFYIMQHSRKSSSMSKKCLGCLLELRERCSSISEQGISSHTYFCHDHHELPFFESAKAREICQVSLGWETERLSSCLSFSLPQGSEAVHLYELIEYL